MSHIPRDKSLDSTLSLLYDGFTFIQKRCRRFQSDLFEARIMGEMAVCMSGEEAARLFYDTDKFQREGAVPARIKKSLFGKGGVQTLDGKAHSHRKEMFMSLMKPGSIHSLMNLIADQWQGYMNRWETAEDIVLFKGVQEILCRAACSWVGVPLKETEVRQRTDDFWAMVDAFGAVGPRHWRGRRARNRTEKWIGKIIEKIRNEDLKIPEDTPAYMIAHHRQLDGNLLDTHVATVEVINLIRPIVAISNYIVFSALALHRHPEYRNKIWAGTDDYDELFVQEVRRYYPFAPILGARVRSEFEWRDYQFREGQLVLLDVYGTNHDPNLWENPEEFLPERFKDWGGSLFSFIPQGGNNHDDGHRCAGEWITIEAMKTGLDFLTRYMDYEVPDQDLEFSLSRMPTYPRSGFIISGVKKREKIS